MVMPGIAFVRRSSKRGSKRAGKPDPGSLGNLTWNRGPNAGSGYGGSNTALTPASNLNLNLNQGSSPASFGGYPGSGGYPGHGASTPGTPGTLFGYTSYHGYHSYPGNHGYPGWI
eukprot:sb/3476791/